LHKKNPNNIFGLKGVAQRGLSRALIKNL